MDKRRREESSSDPSALQTWRAPRKRQLHSLIPSELTADSTDVEYSNSHDMLVEIDLDLDEKLEYAGSFKLRFATDKSVRKVKKKRKRRAPKVEEESEEDEEGVGGDGVDSENESKTARKLTEKEFEEKRIKLQETNHKSLDEDFPVASTEAPKKQSRVPDTLHDEQVDIELQTLVSEQPPPHPMRGPHSSLDDTAINNNNSNDFHFYALNLEPRIDPKIKERANIAIRNAAFQAAFPEVSCAQSCSKLCRNCCEFEPCKYPGDNSAASFTPEMKSARTQGVAMLKTLLFPAVPRLLRDVWIAIELVVTIYQLVLSSISLSLNHVETFNITYVVLASIALILAVLDALIHLGSCAATVFYCRSNSNNPTQHKDEQCSIDPGNIQDCCLLSKIHRQQASEYSDIVRNIVTELIFYPLLICNMFDFIVSGSYRRQDSAEKINFSLFVVGGFYLVLSVYIARFFMITFSLMSLRKVPESIAYTQRFYWNLTIKFGLHVLLQLIVSVFIIAAIGVGIHNENESPCDEGTCIKASPYLISAAVVGGIIPILGTCMFLLTNGHNFRAMTVSLWVDMISMLQYESFATAVFGNEGVKKAKEKVEAFTKHVKFAETKKQLKLFVTSTPFMVKRLYPLRSPFFWFVSILYIVLLGSFFATLLVSFECSVLNRDKLHLGIVFFITAFAALLANIHVITLTIVFTAIVFISLLLVALTPVFVLLGLVLYVPLGCCFSCLVYLHDMAKETSVFSKPAVHTRRIRSALHKTRT